MILDTSVLVASEQHRLELRSVIGHDDPAVAAITATELLLGVERSTGQRRDERAVHVEGVFAALPIEFLIIAATACATGRTLITTDGSAAFADLPGVRAEVVKIS
ncbi:MAG TPA: hypothetical protein VFV67_29535 [Actinophytocola sp.]|uniref:hypothetical protein n=1 Tax=Actinophytocola sp. TaxID=1872138 RepID=UPI002DB5ED07|nr:hypothetical protein [Actinophytocola sp.]HEU5474806.1 hypothetical protein [Actinophytocola sp.]